MRNPAVLTQDEWLKNERITSRQKSKVESEFKDASKLDLRNEIQEQYGVKQKPWFSWVFDALKFNHHSRVLELGSGSGALWDENLERIPGKWEIFLTDPSTAMLERARESLHNNHRKTHFLGVDGQTLPFIDESFDAVIAIGVLDLLPQLDHSLREIHRVLKPSGVFVTTAGGKGHLQELESLVSPYIPAQKAKDIGGDERKFGLENGKDWLSCCFEKIVRHHYEDQMVFPELEPVLKYLLSETVVESSINLEQLSELVEQINQLLARDGSIRVSVRKGVFTARKKAFLAEPAR